MDVARDRRSNSRRGLLLKAAVVVPDVLISGLLTLVILDALPPVIGLGVLMFGVVVSVVLALGFWEGSIVRLLYRGRRPTSREAVQLAAAWRLVSSSVDTGGVQLCLTSAGPPIASAGRRHVLLAREVLEAHRASRITDGQVVALIAHGIGRLRNGRTRFDLMFLFWTAPWDIIRGLLVGLGHQLSWIPLGRFAWQARFVVGSIAVVLETQAGRWPSPMVIAVFIALTYLMPRWRQGWDWYVKEEADLSALSLADGMSATAVIVPT